MQQAYNVLLKMRTTEVEVLDEVKSHYVLGDILENFFFFFYQHAFPEDFHRSACLMV